MAAAKGNKYAHNANERDPGCISGRPRVYNDETHPKAVSKLRLLGFTDVEVADALAISIDTLDYWKRTHENFLRAYEAGGCMADADVAANLYKRATGYDRVVEKEVVGKDGEIVTITETIHYPPDPRSMQYWLGNRQRGRWTNQQKVEVTGPDGQALQNNVQVVVMLPGTDAPKAIEHAPAAASPQLELPANERDGGEETPA